MKALLNIWRVMRVSRVLDDRTDRSNRAEAELDEQGRVDAELADSRRLPWRRPSPRVKSRVLLEIEARRYHRSHRREWPVWPLRLAVLGALALLVWGSPLLRQATPSPETAPVGPVAAAQPAAVERGIDEELSDEAAAIGEDTRRAAELLLGRLPFGGY